MPQPTAAVRVERIPGAARIPLPQRATTGSAGFDLCAAETVDLRRGRISIVRTGLKLRAPAGTFLEVRPRSGLSSKGVQMVNAPGTIDRDYPGEVCVILTYLLSGSYRIEVGDRIAQVRVVEDLPTKFRSGPVRRSSSRRGGFGSTGR